MCSHKGMQFVKDNNLFNSKFGRSVVLPESFCQHLWVIKCY